MDTHFALWVALVVSDEFNLLKFTLLQTEDLLFGNIHLFLGGSCLFFYFCFKGIIMFSVTQVGKSEIRLYSHLFISGFAL